MKNNIVYLALIIILSSCGMSNNFNKQKFTNLKKVKPNKVEVANFDQNIKQPTYITEENFGSITSEEIIYEAEESDVFESKTDQVQITDEQVYVQIERPRLVSEKQNHQIPLEINRDDKEAVEDMLKISKIFFWMGIGSAFIQLVTFVLLLVFHASMVGAFTWVNLMYLSLFAGILMLISFIAAFVTAMIYRKKAHQTKAELKRTSWYTIWISSITLGVVFFGNLLFTVICYIEAFF